MPNESRVFASPHRRRHFVEPNRNHYLKYKPLPGAQIRYLVFHGSHLPAALGFSAAAECLDNDWKDRHGYEPVLLETFVDRHRFRGIYYRPANWIHVGETQGRGKLDRQHPRPLPLKHVYLYPLHKRFRLGLRAALDPRD